MATDPNFSPKFACRSCVGRVESPKKGQKGLIEFGECFRRFSVIRWCQNPFSPRGSVQNSKKNISVILQCFRLRVRCFTNLYPRVAGSRGITPGLVQ